jgi:serpin B
LAAALNTVGWDLFSGGSLPADDNIVLSPASIGHTLLMARAAADPATGAAIDAALGLPTGMAAHEAWNVIDLAMSRAADAEDELTIALADRIWPRTGLSPDQTWVDTLARYHGADVETLDFVADPDGSRDAINAWVGDRTDQLIPDLLPPGFITDQTVLVLTDAIYLAAQWQTPFGKYPTADGPFTLLDGSTVQVPLMHELELRSARGAGDGYVGAEIPYVGGSLSMLVIVPDEGRFAEIRDRLGPDLLREIDATFTTGGFELVLPTWEDELEQLDLIGWLQDIGAAPGSYPAITPDATLESAVHGATIAVDEWGTVASAATAFGFDESAAEPPDLVVAADRPFLYLIRDVDSGLVLFLGQVTHP